MTLAVEAPTDAQLGYIASLDDEQRERDAFSEGRPAYETDAD